MLEIYIDQSKTKHVTTDIIRNALHVNDVINFTFVYCKTKQLSLYESGDSVFQSLGTLGGFVRKVALPSVSLRDQSRDSAQSVGSMSANTVALVSRHVVQLAQLPVLVVDSNAMPIGNIGNIHQNAEIDILPVDVDEACVHLCDPKFRTDLNVRMYAKLRKSGDLRALRGSIVHLWGAMSQPGHGILVEHDATAGNGLRIIIRDRRREAPFAQEGDSGAMVCYHDRENDV
ncbi:hypothetical protein DPMN_181287 [Dreissena polymorpha]|uniref:Uncharacterized protein n=2 Tax=Dreissena polymorpha TaxID=45954 RepID=A0A9D4DE70_DREPO|nr:hypothetical protein DPMN_181287 [Dreissena polymorpha]